jgi:hypothetical protein
VSTNTAKLVRADSRDELLVAANLPNPDRPVIFREFLKIKAEVRYTKKHSIAMLFSEHEYWQL